MRYENENTKALSATSEMSSEYANLKFSALCVKAKALK